MIYLLLAIGLLLIGITLRPTLNWLKKDNQGAGIEPLLRVSGDRLPEKWLAEEIKEMQAKLDLLAEAASEANQQLGKIDARFVPAQIDAKESGFQLALAKETQSVLQQAICRAFDEGKGVQEIAREFKRGKGEIELVLNLRKSGKT
jgi:transposase-like protein